MTMLHENVTEKFCKYIQEKVPCLSCIQSKRLIREYFQDDSTLEGKEVDSQKNMCYDGRE